MKNLIKDTYVLFLKKMPLWVLFVVPLAVFSYTDDCFRETVRISDLMQYAGLLLFVATQLVIMRYVMSVSLGNVLAVLKKLLLVAVFQVVMAYVMMLPIFVFMQIMAHHHIDAMSYTWLALLLNTLVGGWLFAKMATIIPLLVASEKITWAKFKAFSKDGYWNWWLVSALIYLPYYASYYLIDCDWKNTVISSLTMVIFNIFNGLYYKSKQF